VNAIRRRKQASISLDGRYRAAFTPRTNVRRQFAFRNHLRESLADAAFLDYASLCKPETSA
jgi:hypothetical protein